MFKFEPTSCFKTKSSCFLIFTIIALGLLQNSRIVSASMASPVSTAITDEASEARGCQYHPIRGAATVFFALGLGFESTLASQNINFMVMMMMIVVKLVL